MSKLRAVFGQAVGAHRAAVAQLRAARAALDADRAGDSDTDRAALADRARRAARNLAPGWLGADWSAVAELPVGRDAGAGAPAPVRIGTVVPAGAAPDLCYPAVVPLLGVGHLAADAPDATPLLSGALLRLVAAAPAGLIRICWVGAGLPAAFRPLRAAGMLIEADPDTALAAADRQLAHAAEAVRAGHDPAGVPYLLLVAAERLPPGRVRPLAEQGPAGRLHLLLAAQPAPLPHTTSVRLDARSGSPGALRADGAAGAAAPGSAAKAAAPVPPGGEADGSGSIGGVDGARSAGGEADGSGSIGGADGARSTDEADAPGSIGGADGARSTDEADAPGSIGGVDGARSAGGEVDAPGSPGGADRPGSAGAARIRYADGAEAPVRLDAAPPDEVVATVCQRLAGSLRPGFGLLVPPRRWAERSTTGLRTPIGVGAGGVAELVCAGPTPHWLVTGSPRAAGAAVLTALYGLAARYSPDELAVHLLDASGLGLFAEFAPGGSDPSWLPHARSVGTPDGAETLARVLAELTAELADRRRTLAAAGHADLAAAASAADTALPRILLVLAGADVAFARAVAGRARAEQVLTELAASGAAAGVHLLVSAEHPPSAAFPRLPGRLTVSGVDGSAVLGDRPVRLIDPFGDPGQRATLRDALWRARTPGSAPPSVPHPTEPTSVAEE